MEFSGLRKQYEALSSHILSAIGQVLDEGVYIGGGQIARLEQRFTALTGCRFCLCCASGTDALVLALMAWGARAGEAVFLPSFTFAATAEAVALRGATPVFVDVDDTLNLDPAALETAITQVRREGWLRPAGIVAVDLFGVPADYGRIGAIARREGLWLLEDAAQSFGASRGGQQACSFGEIAATSFFPSKPLGCYGDGGAVFTGDARLAETIDSLRVHGRGNGKYDNRIVGINSRLDTLQAAILLEKLCVFPQELARRREVAEIYTRDLGGWVGLPVIPDDTQPSWAQYTIRLPNRTLRDRLRLALSTCGIPSAVYYPKPLHLQGAFAYLGLPKGALPRSEDACEQVLSLPMHPYLTDEEVAFVCHAVREFMQENA
jgi:UDP-2-acetamido-2-deoxy-ribo-hexuluronate aminotransferase